MTNYDRPTRLVAICLAAVAGYVDAGGFIVTGGFFVSFMSGHTTRLGLALAETPLGAAIATGLIVAFIGGVVAGSLLGRAAGPRRAATVLGLVAGLLAGSALLHGVGWEAPGVALLGLAMGAVNTVFARDGEVRVGLTYMTGALVKVGQRLAAALTGGDPLSFAPPAPLGEHGRRRGSRRGSSCALRHQRTLGGRGGGRPARGSQPHPG